MLRRDFLKAVGAAVSLAPLSSLPAFAETAPTILWLKRGGEQAQVDYSTTEGYAAARYLLRDVQAGVAGYPHIALLQLLSWEQAWLAAYNVYDYFDVFSGMRTPATNNRTEGAARASWHLPDAEGVFRASDIHHRLISPEYLGRLAALAAQGGVGFYIRKAFVHHDVGRIRYWRK